MNTEIIAETSDATLIGTISFPEAVAKFLSAGVEYYHVDYIGMRKTFYGVDSEMITRSIPIEGLPSVAAEFSTETLRANILDSQQHGQKFLDFSRRAKACGVQGYFAFLRGKRVAYWGRQGDQHTEWFPALNRSCPNCMQTKRDAEHHYQCQPWHLS